MIGDDGGSREVSDEYEIAWTWDVEDGWDYEIVRFWDVEYDSVVMILRF